MPLRTFCPIIPLGAIALPNYFMKSELIEQAAAIITDPQLFINVVSRRVEQLTSPKSPFRSPLVPTMPHTAAADIALMEIIAGKLSYRFEEPVVEELDITEVSTFSEGYMGDDDIPDMGDLSLDDEDEDQ